ncbi:MAG: TSCPD domain-containing protein [Negativicutes bacterium]
MKTYCTEGVCAMEIHFEIENGILKDVKFYRIRRTPQ